MAKMMNQQAAAPELLQYSVCAYEPKSCNINCLQNNQPCMVFIVKPYYCLFVIWRTFAQIH